VAGLGTSDCEQEIPKARNAVVVEFAGIFIDLITGFIVEITLPTTFHLLVRQRATANQDNGISSEKSIYYHNGYIMKPTAF
jgi:hypothetical protein